MSILNILMIFLKKELLIFIRSKIIYFFSIVFSVSIFLGLYIFFLFIQKKYFQLSIQIDEFQFVLASIIVWFSLTLLIDYAKYGIKRDKYEGSFNLTLYTSKNYLLLQFLSYGLFYYLSFFFITILALLILVIFNFFTINQVYIICFFSFSAFFYSIGLCYFISILNLTSSKLINNLVGFVILLIFFTSNIMLNIDKLIPSISSYLDSFQLFKKYFDIFQLLLKHDTNIIYVLLHYFYLPLVGILLSYLLINFFEINKKYIND